MLECCKFYAVLLSDVIGIYDVYKNSHRPAIRNAVQVPLHDTLLQITAMDAVTTHLGFAHTYSANYTQPYKLAREFFTLDHITKWCIIWIIVTSYVIIDCVNQCLDKTHE